jgi:crotonobetainyl-CoA:carnitine CoA-transferase CaiB-like acyl-CoA transferase
MSAAPLQGVRVLNLGGIWAGRVTAMLLADQGAEVIEIDAPGRAARAEDPLLLRGKTRISLDLASADGGATAKALAVEADIVIDNLGTGRAKRFGLDADALTAANPALVYVSVPGFASGSPLADMPAWEGTIDASVGIYTDLHATGALLGGPPIYTAVPMASSYAGVHAAINATLGYFARLKTGRGAHVEVPMADALMSAMALLAMRIDGQPARFDLPAIDKAMTDVAFPILRDLAPQLSDAHRAAISAYLRRFAKPLFTHYRCADGRIVFLNALDHVHHSRACLESLGLLNQLISEGMTLGSPYGEGGDNNLANAATLAPHWTARLQTLMSERFLSRPADAWCRLLQEAGVPCAKVRTTQEWLADPVARESGCVAQVGGPEGHWQAGRFVSIGGAAVSSPPLAPASPVSAYRGWRSRAAQPALADAPASSPGRMLEGLRVLDLSNVIAGPVCARTLAEFGADVVRVDAPAPQAGPRMTMWFGVDVNQGKRAIILDLKSADGQAVLADLVRDADVVIHNFLDRSLEGIGITESRLRRIKPDIVCCQISAWAGPDGGAYKGFPAFDPVLQAATGITARYGTLDAPVMHGVASCVDYVSGFCAALGIAQALVAKAAGRGGSLVRTSLAMGAQLVQFPFVVETAQDGAEIGGQQRKGSAPHHSMVQTADGWAFFGCRPASLGDIAMALSAADEGGPALVAALRPLTLDAIREALAGFDGASIVPVMSLEAVRRACTVQAPPSTAFDLAGRSTPMVEGDHPSGYRTTLPFPSWSRWTGGTAQRLSPAPMPGSDTLSVLAERGLEAVRLQHLTDTGVIRERWAVHHRYFPL